MRVGLDLRGIASTEERRRLAVEADRLGLWSVLVAGRPGTECVAAAALAVATSDIVLSVLIDGHDEHPLTVAEEIAVLDHLSARRSHPILDAPADRRRHVDRLLAGAIVDGVALAPPPAQSHLVTTPSNDVVVEHLSGDPVPDAAAIDRHRDSGTTHLFVTWPGSSLLPLARHLVSRAAAPDFPMIVAEWADRIDPEPLADEQ